MTSSWFLIPQLLQVLLKSGKNIEHFTWIPKYVFFLSVAPLTCCRCCLFDWSGIRLLEQPRRYKYCANATQCYVLRYLDYCKVWSKIKIPTDITFQCLEITVVDARVLRRTSHLIFCHEDGSRVFLLSNDSLYHATCYYSPKDKSIKMEHLVLLSVPGIRVFHLPHMTVERRI